MVRCDLAAAALTVLMAVPAVPVPALFVLVFAVSLFNSPFAAARSALVRDLFPDDRYAAATTVSTMTFGASQILGYAAGGLLVAGFGARAALGSAAPVRRSAC
jgi:MFS family permease